MGLFIISTFLIIMILSEKLYFFLSEPLYFSNIWGKSEILVLFSLFIFAFVIFLKNNKKIGILKKRDKVGKLGLIATLLIFLVVGFSLYLNINKKGLAWDAIALYDARAKFLLSGTKFSEMVSLTKYDLHNSYYYLLYPPFTSIAHFFWYKLGIQLPVGIQYSSYLFLLASGIYLGTKNFIGKNWALLLSFLTISSNAVFSSSLVEYTNLPFTLFLIVGIFLLMHYINTKELWMLIYGSVLISTSQWIRYLEPIWIGIFLALLITEIRIVKFKFFIKLTSFLGLLGFFEYFMWKYFVTEIANNPQIIKLNIIYLIEPIFGIFTGTLLRILIIYIKFWGLILFFHLSALTTGIRLKREKFIKGNNHILFLKLVILFTILIYFLGFYFVSFQSDWWDKLGNSLVRSSTFLIPISGYIIFDFMQMKFSKKN